MNNKKNLIIIIFVFAGVVALSGSFILFGSLISPNPISNNNVQSAEVLYKSNITSGAGVVTNTNHKYKDGEYTVNADYLDPNNKVEKMIVRVILSEDSIVEASNAYPNSSRESRGYQATFERQIKNKILNKKIDTIDKSLIGGASLTSEAFNIALSKIKTSAKL